MSPALDYFAKTALAPTVLLAPVAISATGVSTGVSTVDLDGCGFAVVSIFNKSGTTPSMTCTLQTSDEVVPIASITYAGTGNGTLTDIIAGPSAVHETITIAMTSATILEVSGSVTGAMTSGTVGTAYSTAQASFIVTAGSTAFEAGDTFTFHITKARDYTTVKAFDSLGAASITHNEVINFDELGKITRLSYTLAGTSPVYTIGANLYGFKR